MSNGNDLNLALDSSRTEEVRKTYETPKLDRIGTVQELTRVWDGSIP